MTEVTHDPLYSLAHLTLINATTPELIYIADRAGYDAVSPRFIPMNVPGEFKQSPIDRPNDRSYKDCSKNYRH